MLTQKNAQEQQKNFKTYEADFEGNLISYASLI